MRREKRTITKITAVVTAVIFIVLLVCTLAGCAKQWTCDWCGRTWRGDAYYGSEYSETLCADCAAQYWEPFPISQYKKK